MSRDSGALDLKTLAMTPQVCVCFNLRKASRAITQIYEEALQPAGIRGTQYSLLVGISLGGAAGVGALAEGLATDRTTITRNLRPLVDGGFIEMVPGPDRRRRVVRLTRKGRATLKMAYPLWVGAQRRVMRELGEERFAVLKSVVDDVVTMAQGV